MDDGGVSTRATDGMLDETLALEDVSTSEAYHILNALLDSGAISPERVDKAKSQYAKLHSSLVLALGREKRALQDVKDLNKRLEAGSHVTINSLREDVESANSMAAMAQEKVQLLQLEVTDLQRQRDELDEKTVELRAEYKAALVPMIENLENELTELRDEIKQEKENEEDLRREVVTYSNAINKVEDEVAEQTTTRNLERVTLAKLEFAPDKSRKQNDALVMMMRNVQQQLDSAAGRLGELDSILKGIYIRQSNTQDEHQRLLAALEKGRVQVEGKERHADDIRKDVELAAVEADKILGDQVELDMKLKNLGVDVKVEQETLLRRFRERDATLRSLRGLELQLKELRDTTPGHLYAISQLQKRKGLLEETVEAQAKTIDELKQDLDIAMNNFLKEESIGKDKAALFQLTYKQVGVLEKDVQQLKKEEAERNKVLLDLGAEKDRIVLAIAQKYSRIREVKLESKIKLVELAELRKIRKDVSKRIKDFEKLYDLVKNQRNKFVNLIQAASQSTTEMKDKLKIMANELDILHNDVHNKDKLLSQSRAQYHAVVADRDQLRVELGKHGMTFREKQEVVDEQIAEVDKLNAIINTQEKEMLRLKKQYELVIEARNYTGLMLIDRNDELCILYEKSNIQEARLRSGELELQRREDEIRLLRLEVKEFQCSVETAKKLLPTIPLLDEDVARLQKELLVARRESEELSLSLETPANTSRWRLLEGKIPDREELTARISSLEERLALKREALLEKELILEEISGLSDKLRTQAAEGRSDTLELAKKANDYQNKLRAVTRKIMAAVSELSMYQATSLKLAAEHEQLRGVKAIAAERMAAGLPPSDDAEREWYRLLRERVMMESYDAARAEEARVVMERIQDVATTADPRPNAYIPEEIGIPKPYGTFAPFKPSETGSTMRHIRKPQPKEIVI